MGKNELDLGMINISHFWKSIKLSWLRRLAYSKSTWAMIHRDDTKPNMFDPMLSNWTTLEMARSSMRNLVWKEVYKGLDVMQEKCREVQSN